MITTRMRVIQQNYLWRYNKIFPTDESWQTRHSRKTGWTGFAFISFNINSGSWYSSIAYNIGSTKVKIYIYTFSNYSNSKSNNTNLVYLLPFSPMGPGNPVIPGNPEKIGCFHYCIKAICSHRYVGIIIDYQKP